MSRRDFIKLLGGASIVWPLVARAQQAAIPLIGFLGSSSKTDTQQYISAFLQGMGGFGYVEERSYAMHQRYAEGDLSRLTLLVQELLRLQPQVIVADSTPGTLAAKKATPDVPIVGLNMTDPVGLGLVVSEEFSRMLFSSPRADKSRLLHWRHGCLQSMPDAISSRMGA